MTRTGRPVVPWLPDEGAFDQLCAVVDHDAERSRRPLGHAGRPPPLARRREAAFVGPWPEGTEGTVIEFHPQPPLMWWGEPESGRPACRVDAWNP